MRWDVTNVVGEKELEGNKEKRTCRQQDVQETLRAHDGELVEYEIRDRDIEE